MKLKANKMLKKSVTKFQYCLTRVHLFHQLSSPKDISYSHVDYLSIIHSLFAWVSLFPDVATPALTQPWQNWWGLLKLFRQPRSKWEQSCAHCLNWLHISVRFWLVLVLQPQSLSLSHTWCWDNSEHGEWSPP